MSESPRPLDHLSRAVEELLRAGADALSLWQQNEGPVLHRVREALEREHARWDLRGADDPAAARVRDFFSAILEVLEPDEPSRPAENERAARRRSRRRVDPSGDRVGYSGR